LTYPVKGPGAVLCGELAEAPAALGEVWDEVPSPTKQSIPAHAEVYRFAFERVTRRRYRQIARRPTEAAPLQKKAAYPQEDCRLGLTILVQSAL
jgi:hypothetical protein